MSWLKNKTTIQLAIYLLLIICSQGLKRHTSQAAGLERNNFVSYGAADTQKYQQILNHAQKHQLSNAPIATIVQVVAEQFLGAEYQAGLLDRSIHETLVISLQQFDCMLFIETVLAIADNIARQENSYQAFVDGVEQQRYWNGTMNGYCSRLHYFSDWLADNQARGRIKNITAELGGINTTKKLNFMTTHRNSYPNLAKSSSQTKLVSGRDRNFQCIAEVEETLPTTFNYIPTQQIDSIYAQLKPGDIIGVATNIPGLDFTHTGLVYQQPNGGIGLIHASPAGTVTIAKDLQKYIGNVKNAVGIVVSRASEPKLP
ncbi:MAG: N-acetylmuramoyl-L-alanine amidase-like domain-containing protein [Cyanobacteria bacterium J06623_7]